MMNHVQGSNLTPVLPLHLLLLGTDPGEQGQNEGR